ncbi:MAG: putative lipopolysaccharide heptosyltransferase III [Nitrospirae bacterium]|nr:putative lipopolysaccharide heptosyltransferase III [Nitrospirota bacterium]
MKNCGFHDIKKILVIKLRNIGDVLLAAPVFRPLKESFPEAQISALVNSGTEDVLRGNPLLDEIIVLDRNIKKLPKVKRYLQEALFLKKLRDVGFDMTVDLTGGDRAAVISLVSGARFRLGWKDKKGFAGKQRFYTHLSEPEHKRHTVLQNLDVVKRWGIITGNLSVDFYVSDADMAFAKRVFEEAGAESHTKEIHIHPTSRWLFKCWKDEYMAQVVRWLLSKDCTVVFTSSPEKKELEKARNILSLAGVHKNLIDLCGKTSIKQLGAISKMADLFFGVDSAPMHIAAAVGTPVVALFGPSGAFHWGPWDNGWLASDFIYNQKNGTQKTGRHEVLQLDWDCIPCGKDGCKSSKISDCLYAITPDTVINVLDKKLFEARK